MKPRLLAFAVGLLFAPVAFAAPAPSEPRNNGGPILTAQVKSLDQLRVAVKAMAKNFVVEALNDAFEKEFLSKFDEKALKGIDQKKPAGLYGVVGAGLLRGDFAKSSMVFLIPVTDENDFIDLLRKIDLKPEKKGESWSMPIPNSPFEATIWYRKGYAYIGVGTEKIDPKTLLDPRDLINDQETAAIAIRLRVDHLPEDFKTDILALLTQAADEADGNFNRAQVPAGIRELTAQFFSISSRWLKALTGEVKELLVRVDIDPKTGLLIVEKTIEAKSGAPSPSRLPA